MDANGPDQSDGINGAQCEKSFILRLPNQHIGGAPTRVLTQLVKDKDNSTKVGQVESSPWFSKSAVTTLSLEAQNLQDDVLYNWRVEPRYKYFHYKGRKRLKVCSSR